LTFSIYGNTKAPRRKISVATYLGSGRLGSTIALTRKGKKTVGTTKRASCKTGVRQEGRGGNPTVEEDTRGAETAVTYQGPQKKKEGEHGQGGESGRIGPGAKRMRKIDHLRGGRVTCRKAENLPIGYLGKTNNVGASMFQAEDA